MMKGMFSRLLNCKVGAHSTHRDTDVCLPERGCIVDTVAYCENAATLAQGIDRLELILRQELELDVIRTDLSSDLSCRRFTVTRKDNGVLDAEQTKWTWSNDSFDVIISKGSSSYTLYKTAKAYMQLKKQNTFTLINTSGAMIDHQIESLKRNNLAGLELRNVDGTNGADITLDKVDYKFVKQDDILAVVTD